MSRRVGHRAGPFLLFAALSLAAVAIGCWVAAANGAPASEWMRNLAAWAVGGLLAAALARWSGPKAWLGFLVAALLGLALTLLAGGLEGVHRWVQLGPLRINVAEVLLPAALVAAARLGIGRLGSGWLVLALGAAILALLVAQPDASQTSAFGGALILLIAGAPLSRGWRSVGLAVVALAAVGSWLRHDPLAPVPVVEGIMGLAWTLSPFAAALAWAALGGAMLAPLAVGRGAGEGLRAAAVALAAYGVLSALAPLAGAFPVPLVGMGMSPVLGLWLGVGLLAGRKGAEP
jgi:cell division protein FtsW (lipid II flippase)